MGKVWVKEFTGGLDTRRLPATTPGGVLIKGLNGHINSGGEFESRAAFVTAYDLPEGTVGLAADAGGLVVFGSDADPGVPTGVTYQQLVKDDKVLDDVPSWDLYTDKIYAVGEFTDATIVHFYDEVEVDDWFDGRARASFDVVSGTDASSTLDILVNGVSVMSGAVTYDTNNETTAAAIATAINSHTSSPDYDATSVGGQVNIIAATAGASSNGFAVTFIVTNNFVTSPTSGLALENGADSAAFVPGTFVKTSGRKMMALSGTTWHLSGSNEPTQWTTDVTGAAFFDQAKEASKMRDLQAIADYQGFIALFAENNVLIWFVDPDPDLISKRQVLARTGTVSPRSVTEFGDADVFYVARSGIRSMRARDSSNNATTSDIGSPIDTLVSTKLATMTAADKTGIIGLMNPVDDRLWMIFPDGEIFVFSYFPNAKVSAWTTYETGFPVSHAVILGDRVYLRSGDTIYVYGGTDESAALTYDDTVAKAHLPFFDGGAPSASKKWNGVDAALDGQWQVYGAMQPTDVTIRELLMTLTETTYNRLRHPMAVDSSHLSLQFESTGTGPHVLSSVIAHNDLEEDQ